MLVFLIVWAILATIWAITITILFIYNPFPFPDRGHRVFGVKDEKTRAIVVKIIENLTGKKSRFTFDAGDIHQTILHDGFTVIHYIDEKPDKIASCGISFAVKNPQRSAQEVIQLLKAEGFQAGVIEDVKLDLPPNNLVPVYSNAFDGWVLVFRRPLIKMPKPNFRN